LNGIIVARHSRDYAPRVDNHGGDSVIFRVNAAVTSAAPDWPTRSDEAEMVRGQAEEDP
jgi:hypothetical protein